MSLDDRRKNRAVRRRLLVYVGLALVGAMVLYGLAPLLHQWWGMLLRGAANLVRRLFSP